MTSWTPQKIEDRADEALAYLIKTDEELADLKYDTEAAEHKHGATIDAHFLLLEGTVESRKANARRAPESESAFHEFLEAQRRYDYVANKRKSEAMVIEWLRSLYSARKQG